ncbi:MAG: hypothetical protein ACR2N0_08690 [Rubrobacteraceae bacterium]
MQTAQVKTTGRFGAFRAALAAGLAFWVVIVALFAASSVDSGGADAAINAAFVAAFLLAGAGFAAAICKVGGAERVFWILLAGGLLARVAGALIGSTGLSASARPPTTSSRTRFRTCSSSAPCCGCSD